MASRSGESFFAISRLSMAPAASPCCRSAPEFEPCHFIIGLGLNHFTQEGRRLVRVALHEKRVAEMIASDGIAGANLQLGAEFRGCRFEIALEKSRGIVGRTNGYGEGRIKTKQQHDSQKTM